MYRFVDQPVDRIADGSHFLLWAMRAWVRAAGQERCPAVALASSFTRMSALEVLDDFHGLMLACHVHRTVPLTFGTVHAPRITETEAIMLALWSDTVFDQLEHVRAVFALMIAEAQVGRVVARMVRVAAHMSTLGIAPAGLRHDIPLPQATGRAG